MDNMILHKDYSFARVYQSLNLSANLKTRAEDFIVEEHMSVEFSGEGEHCWLYIEKRGCNTDWLAQQLADYCGVKKMAVAYAGLKDRHALTSQWFSVQLPGRPTPDWSDFESAFGSAGEGESVRILQCFRHNRKLQRGALKNNAFRITLRELSNTSDETFDLLAQRCRLIAQAGVPNYFGPQRFGHNNNNLEQAARFFSRPRYKIAKQKRSMYLSAARSWLFNCILSERIKLHVWDKRLPGDVFMLDGKSACFKDDGSDDIDDRLENNAIHPTAILWGEGDVMVTADAAILESRIIDLFPVFRDGLIAARLQAARRACRVIPDHFEYCQQDNTFIVSFSLPAGSYATSVLDEIFSQLTVPA